MDCVYIDPKLDWKMIIIISIVVAVFTAPLNLVVDFLFDDILSAPTADSLKAQNEANAMLQAGRRMSNAVRRASLSAATAIRRASNAASTFVSGMNPKRRKTTRLTMTQIMPAETISAQSLALACGPNLLNLLKEEGTHLQDLKPVPKYIPKDKKYHVLITEIEKQRQMLRPSEIHLYDISWGYVVQIFSFAILSKNFFVVVFIKIRTRHRGGASCVSVMSVRLLFNMSWSLLKRRQRSGIKSCLKCLTPTSEWSYSI